VFDNPARLRVNPEYPAWLPSMPIAADLLGLRADTGTSTGRLMLAVLGGLADVERDLIRTRTAEGRSRAKAQGKLMGRPLP